MNQVPAATVASLVTILVASAVATGGCAQPPQIIALDKRAELDRPGQMTITGSATLDVSPDCADLTMTLSTEAARPGAAAASVQAKQEALLAKLAKLGIETSDVKLSHLALDPVHDRDEHGRIVRVRGFAAAITITATTKSFGKIGAMMEAGADAGATTMSSQFRRSDLAALKKKVRDMALAAAKDKAKQTAGTLGIELGPIVSVAETAGGMWHQAYFPNMTATVATAAGGGAVGGALQPLTLDITIGYELGRG